MCSKRIFKLKPFGRWAKKVLTDEQLCNAAREIEKGIFEADLGGGVCKKRIAIDGQGKSGATRTLAAMHHKTAIFFLVGREKSSPGKDFDDAQVEVAKKLAKGLSSANQAKIDEMLRDGTIEEIVCHEQD